MIPQFLGDEPHEIDDVLRPAGELGAQARILRGNADRAGVEVADTHHDAARGDERAGGETELLSTEQRGDGDIAAGLQLAVGLDRDAVTEIVKHKGLVRLGETEFPRQAGVLDRGQR